MKLRYTTEALQELDATLDFIAGQSPRGARQVQRRIKAKTSLLRKHPLAGPMTAIMGVRQIFASPYPYALYYRVTATDIVIVAVRHTASDIGSSPVR
ncbi:type II toxin-antitoxin system RelE/ParE family toxin [Bosea sp. PAMC 26642]|uniref:type II toxin-antitoxin system RelE/ParE family toxin n=1 Tax=Bosea sp. (strain PAMC 26642) TaxID=1792307 RepID=UPI0007704E68|nr:type II toxin-antitoxin system RelE/ParE family toxin [Bosea sp. PAMC 26642]AMJ60887.1 hypothetical protein AXW83_11790 [Bosea sp. PAMC 26642]